MQGLTSCTPGTGSVDSWQVGPVAAKIAAGVASRESGRPRVGASSGREAVAVADGAQGLVSAPMWVVQLVRI